MPIAMASTVGRYVAIGVTPYQIESGGTSSVIGSRIPGMPNPTPTRSTVGKSTPKNTDAESRSQTAVSVRSRRPNPRQPLPDGRTRAGVAVAVAVMTGLLR